MKSSLKSRLSPLTNYLFADIDKDTIEEWRDNYDDTEQYPMSLPSKGFYNIVVPNMSSESRLVKQQYKESLLNEIKEIL